MYLHTVADPGQLNWGYSSAWAGESSAWVYFPAVLRCTHAQPRTKPTHAVGREHLNMVRNLLPVNSYPCCWIFYPRSTLLLNQATATPDIDASGYNTTYYQF